MDMEVHKSEHVSTTKQEFNCPCLIAAAMNVKAIAA